MPDADVTFRMSEVPQFERLAQFLKDAMALAEKRDDQEFKALAKEAADDLLALTEAESG